MFFSIYVKELKRNVKGVPFHLFTGGDPVCCARHHFDGPALRTLRAGGNREGVILVRNAEFVRLP